MMALLLFLFILGILIVIHEFGHFIAARKNGVRVERFSLGLGPQLLKKKKNDTEYCLSLIPLGGFVKLAGDSLEEYKGNSDEYFSKPPGRRFWIIFSGPLLNYILGFLCFWLIFFVGYPTLTTKIGGLVEGFGAQEAGIKPGDRIIALDGESTVYWEDMQKLVRSKKEAETVKLTILRDNKEFTVTVRVKEKNLDDQLGQKHQTGLIGVIPSDEIVKVRHGFLQSFVLGISKTLDVTVITYKGLWFMITGRLSVRESVTGPLGIFLITSRAASLGAVAVLHLVAVLNISLGIFNLLPLPILDGGHIFLLGFEKIRGKTISLKTERVITQIGFTLMIFLAVFVTYNDILRFFGDKITKFIGK